MLNIFNEPSELIQYLGTPYTQDCIEAIGYILQTQTQIEQALLLSCNHTHAYLIKSHRNTYIIRSGFTSGYPGEGPKGLASSLQLLLKHNIEVEEINISKKILKKINQAALSDNDLEGISKTKYIRPIQIHEYIYEIYNTIQYQITNDRYYPSELPYSLIDSRLLDLALKFNDDPDYSILTAYTRLEDIIRSKIGANLFSKKLFEKAFCSENNMKSLYFWKDVENEQASNALGRLFTNIFTAYRNERAHSEVDKSHFKQLREFLLINELYLLERESVKK